MKFLTPVLSSLALFAAMASGAETDNQRQLAAKSTKAPTVKSSKAPTMFPTESQAPSDMPSDSPSAMPSVSMMPSDMPSDAPSAMPSVSQSPSSGPTPKSTKAAPIAKAAVRARDLSSSKLLD